VINKTAISGVDDPSDEGSTVDVYAQSSVDQAKGAEPAFYVGSTKVKVTGGWSLPLPEGSGGRRVLQRGRRRLRRHVGAVAICGDPDGDGKPDSDDDGICDDWELHGIDADDDGTIDLPLNDTTTRPTRAQGRLLEVDAMQDSAENIYAPQQGAIDAVVAPSPRRGRQRQRGRASRCTSPGLSTSTTTCPSRSS